MSMYCKKEQTIKETIAQATTSALYDTALYVQTSPEEDTCLRYEKQKNYISGRKIR
jgi:hypothetical protein